MENAARRIGLLGLQRRIVTVKGGAVGTDLLIVVAHIDEDMRMIEGHGSAGAHEFLDADLDHAVSAIVLEVGNGMPGHVRLQMQYRYRAAIRLLASARRC